MQDGVLLFDVFLLPVLYDLRSYYLLKFDFDPRADWSALVQMTTLELPFESPLSRSVAKKLLHSQQIFTLKTQTHILMQQN